MAEEQVAGLVLVCKDSVTPAKTLFWHPAAMVVEGEQRAAPKPAGVGVYSAYSSAPLQAGHAVWSSAAPGRACCPTSAHRCAQVTAQC